VPLYHLIRPLLFRLDAERAHALSLAMWRRVGASAGLSAAARRAFAPRAGRPVEVAGLSFPHAVGLAAGYDKDGVAIAGLAAAGFGHIEVGTVTPRPQSGNPRPRVFRLAADRSLINRLGFPSAGAEAVAARLAAARIGPSVVGVNLGKNKDTPLADAAADYELGLDKLGPHADYVAVNVSSPNTPGLRELERRERLEPLLVRLVRRRDEIVRRRERALPLFVKLSPDLDDGALGEALSAIAAAPADGLIATNTTLARPALESPRSSEPGGLSGAALTARSAAFAEAVHRRTGGRLPLVASGGIMRPTDARARLAAGARLVQLYTGLVYEGFGLLRRTADLIAVPETGVRETSPNPAFRDS
jgi:dihydroorotate dehydrogenase